MGPEPRRSYYRIPGAQNFYVLGAQEILLNKQMNAYQYSYPNYDFLWNLSKLLRS